MLAVGDDLQKQLTASLEIKWVDGGADVPSFDEAVVGAALRIASGRAQPLLNLRSDQAALGEPPSRIGRPLRALCASVFVALLLVAAGFYVRAARYDEAASRQQIELTRLFEASFPDQPVPASVARRMESRLRELQGLRGVAEGVGADVAGSSALSLLYDFLSSLPREMRFGILDLRVGDDVVTVRGQCRSHGDADAIAAALRAGGSLTVEAPRTEQRREEGVTFALRARSVRGVVKREGEKRS